MGRWSARFDWPARVRAHGEHLALVERQAAEAAAVSNGVDWAGRQAEHREEEWSLRGELVAASRKALEKFKDGSRGATLGDVARALELASKLGRLSSGLPTEVKAEPPAENTALLVEINLALDRVYGPEKPLAEAVEVECLPAEPPAALTPAPLPPDGRGRVEEAKP